MNRETAANKKNKALYYIFCGKWGSNAIDTDDDIIMLFYFPLLQTLFLSAIILEIFFSENIILNNIALICLCGWLLIGVGIFSIISTIMLFDRLYGILIGVLLLLLGYDE